MDICETFFVVWNWIWLGIAWYELLSKEEGRREKNHNQIISTAKNEILLSIKFSFFIYQSKTYSSHLEQTHELMKRQSIYHKTDKVSKFHIFLISSIYFWYIYICTIANYWTVTLNSGLPLKESIRLTSTLSSINSWYPVWERADKIYKIHLTINVLETTISDVT